MGEWTRVEGGSADPETYELILGKGERLRARWGIKGDGERWYGLEILSVDATLSHAYYGIKPKDATTSKDDETFLHDKGYKKLLENEGTIDDVAGLPPEKKSGLLTIILKLKQLQLRELTQSSP